MAFGRTAEATDKKLRTRARADVLTILAWTAIDAFYGSNPDKKPMLGRVGEVPRELYEKALAACRAHGRDIPEGFSGPVSIDPGRLWAYTVIPEKVSTRAENERTHPVSGRHHPESG